MARGIDVRYLRTFHLVAMIVWAGLFLPGMTAWKDSVPFLVFVSLYANFVSHFGAWQAARAEDVST